MRLHGLALIALAMAPLVGCSKGSGSGGAFVVLDVDPPHNGIVFLNQSLKIRFSSPVDLATANFNSVAFFVQDAVGRQLSEFVVGSFRHGETAGGGTDPRVLEFLPRLATDDRFLNGGFKPARRYKVVLISGANKSQPVLRDVVGHSLSDDSRIKSFEFRSVSGSTPAELFLDRVMGGPRVTSVDVTPQVGARVGLNALGGAPVEVAIEFNQPLNPHSSNVLLNADPDPRRVARRRNARIRLEYDDPELGKRRWIPALLDMPRNDRTGATVIVRPDGVLPNDAAIRVVVENDLEDLAGGHNRSEPLYERVVATFTTLAAHNAQFDAVVLAFENADLADLDAPFRDPVADIKNGLLQATFDFEGDLVPWTFHPTTRDVVLNTDITQVPISNGPPLKVVGGVFRFHDVIIDKGKIVRGTGTNPMVILCSGSVRVDGTLSVSGSTGSASSSFRTAYIPVAGGAGVCGGGHGGKGSPSAVTSSPRGEAGFGPFGRRTGGGEGGRLACQNGQGSGGGGGGAATQGDPDYYDQKGVPYNGTGGSGGPAGGAAGASYFTDQDPANDFWGRNVDAKGNVVVGEMKSPQAGSGGGGGGDQTTGSTNSPCLPINFFNDGRGGGGGGGGGALIVQALGRITVGPTGRIEADGGEGGGGEFGGRSDRGGGGGGGSGGMVVLMSATGIDLHQHGGRWQGTRDHNFSVTADGDIGRTVWSMKYPSSPGARNAGGFGGMGVVQLMVPPGDDRDGTGDVQDDNIQIMDTNGKPMTGARKLGYLYGGDIRPNPWILPGTFGRFSQFRSRWIATGATTRRSVGPTGGGPRSLRVPGLPGPEWFFAGVQTSGNTTGYISHDSYGHFNPAIVEIGGKKEAPVTARSSTVTTWRGMRVHVLDVAGGLPADGSLANHRARLLDGNSKTQTEMRIVSNDGNVLRLDADEGPLPHGVAAVQVVAQLFGIETEGTPGLGSTYLHRASKQKTSRYPHKNIQIGFAFHLDPASPRINGTKDERRFPQELDTFTWDLESAAARKALRELHYRHARVMVRFNMNYHWDSPDVTPGPLPVGPKTPRTALRFLLVPYRY